MIDVLFINPNSSKYAYQALSDKYSAIETPTWSLLLAQSCRSKGFKVNILDCDAERLSNSKAIERIKLIKPKYTVFTVYGQNPNSGTVNMSGAISLAKDLKEENVETKICFLGSHTSALPMEVLNLKFVDIVFTNEGVYALHELLQINFNCLDSLKKVKGIGYKSEGKSILNPPQKIVPQEKMDIDLPGYAWDLLPFKKKPLDLYRAHYWHTKFDDNTRTPFAAIYTSLGCKFSCNFCMINILNRESNNENVDASNSKGMRFWSPSFISNEFLKLSKMGVTAIRISDEMFFLNKKYYNPLLKNIIDLDLKLNMWAYSRIDTVREDQLEIFKKAGVNWLALGIEAGNQTVRHEVSKGSFKDVNIRDICSKIKNYDINVISNYIFGLSEDNSDTINETLKLAIELNTEMANMYPCQALPGSPMYNIAKNNNWPLPDSYEGYGFLSYDSQPLRSKHLSAKEILKFRDNAWNKYFTNPNYLKKIEIKFGITQRKNIEEMTKIKLKRKILGD